MSLYPGFESDAEPPYTPLGLAPYDRDENGVSEFDKTREAISLSFDTQKDLPPHVRLVGEVAMIAALTMQATQNMIPRDYPINEAAKKGQLAPDQLIELMLSHEILRAVELGRLSHVNVDNVDHLIHQPMQEILMQNPAIDTVLVDDEFCLEQDPVFISNQLLGIDIKRKRMEHSKGSIVTSSHTLFLVDMLDPSNPAREDNKALEPIVLDYVNGQEQRPQWLIPGQTTYVGAYTDRLRTLERDHKHGSPNLDPWTPPPPAKEEIIPIQ